MMYQALFRCDLIHLGRGYPHFQMCKVKFREGKRPLQGHTAYNFKNQALIPNLLLYKSKGGAAYHILNGERKYGFTVLSYQGRNGQGPHTLGCSVGTQ